MNLARVFPRKTNASPDDELAFFDEPELLMPPIDEVHISVTFTYDIPRAEKLARAWESVAPVKIGGPALGDPSGDFIPGRYLKKGYVITSRGCPNKCWFCDVPKREGRKIRELPLTEGFNLLDSNILACSDDHIKKVFKMLGDSGKRIQLTGGLEAARLKPWHVALLWEARPDRLYFAYDEPEDLEPLIEAGKMLNYADFTRHHLRCYVLIGIPGDTFEAAEKRILEAWSAGFLPMAMLWKNKAGDSTEAWREFQGLWAQPPIVRARIKRQYCAR